MAAAVDQNDRRRARRHNDTGSPACCAAPSTSWTAPGLTRVASFALHLEPVSQLQAAEKPPYLSLVLLSRLGARDARRRRDAGGAAAAAAAAAAACRGP